LTVWKKKDIDKNLVRSISEKYSCGLLTACILVNRGIVSDDAVPYFLSDNESLLRDPLTFPDMPEAVERILQAKAKREKVLIFGDRDVDGITAVVLLFDYLRRLGIDAF
jgi:single-stranded-DNA-specific exonuclease